MATYYVHGDTGNDTTGDGSSGNPYATVGKAFTVGGATSTVVYAAGTLRESVSFGSNPTDCQLLAWPGQTRPVLRGDTVRTGFADSGGTHYTKTLATSLNIKSVVVDWDASVTALGFHYGHLRRVTAANVPSTDNSWNYDSATGVLLVRIGANLDPAGFTVATCAGGVNGVTIANGTRCVLDGLRFSLWCDANQGLGYGAIVYGTGNTIANCLFEDTGYHPWGFVAGGTGQVNTDNTATNCVCSGVAGNGGGGCVFYSYDSTTRNLRASGIVFNAYTFLGRDQNPIALPDNAASFSPAWSALNASAFYWHSNAGTNMTDIVWERCVSNHYTGGSTGTVTSVDMTGLNTPAPSDENDADTYPVRFVECVVNTGYQSALIGNAAYIRCVFNMTQTGDHLINAAGRFTNSGTNAVCCFEGCVVYDNLVPTTTANEARSFRVAGTSQKLIFNNCTLINTGTQKGGARAWFRRVSATATVRARGTVFAFTTASATQNYIDYNDAAISDNTLRDYLGCSYWQVGTGRYSQNASYDTWAEWNASIDTAGREESASSVTSATNAEPPESHPIRESARYTVSETARAKVGINGRPYSRNIGAYQYGPIVRGRVRRAGRMMMGRAEGV